MYDRTIWVAGQTAISHTRLQNISDALFDTYFQAPFLETSNTELIYNVGGDLIRVEETVGGIMRRKTELAYVSGNLTTVTMTIYQMNGTTIEKQAVDTLVYSAGSLIRVERVVN